MGNVTTDAPPKDQVLPHELAEAILDAASFAHIGVAVSHLHPDGTIENVYVSRRAAKSWAAHARSCSRAPR